MKIYYIILNSPFMYDHPYLHYLDRNQQERFKQLNQD